MSHADALGPLDQEAAALLDLLDELPGPLLQLRGERLDVVRAGQWVLHLRQLGAQLCVARLGSQR